MEVRVKENFRKQEAWVVVNKMHIICNCMCVSVWWGIAGSGTSDWVVDEDAHDEKNKSALIVL